MPRPAAVVRVDRSDGADHYARHRVVVTAAAGVRAGDVLMAEAPQVAVATTTNATGGPSWWMCDFSAWAPPGEPALHTPHTADECFLLFLVEAVLRRQRELVVNPGWMDGYIADSPVQATSDATASQSAGVIDGLIAAYNMAPRHRSTLLRLLGIFRSNAFNCLTPLSRVTIGMAFYSGAAYFNHACEPNAIYTMGAGQRIEVRAARAMAAGDEVCISYFDPLGQGPAGLAADTLAFACRCCAPRRADRAAVKAVDAMIANFERFRGPAGVRATQRAMYAGADVSLQDACAALACARLRRHEHTRPTPSFDMIALQTLQRVRRLRLAAAHRDGAATLMAGDDEVQFCALYRSFFGAAAAAAPDATRARVAFVDVLANLELGRAAMHRSDAKTALALAAQAVTLHDTCLLAIAKALHTDRRGALRVLRQEMEVFFVPVGAIP